MTGSLPGVSQPFPHINTTRLALRQLDTSDVSALFILRTDEQVNQYLDRPKPKNLEEVQAFVEKINKSVAQQESLFWAISQQGNPALIGTICLWNLSANRKVIELGYELLPNYHGQGFMTEAAGAVLTYAFETLELNAVLAYTHIENIASRKLLEKHGFVLDVDFDVSEDLHQKFSRSSK